MFLAAPTVLALLNLGIYYSAIVPALTGGHALVYGSFWATFGPTPMSALIGMMRDPGQVIARTLTSGFFKRVITPHLFLPVIGWRWMLGAVPIIVLYGAASNERHSNRSHHGGWKSSDRAGKHHTRSRRRARYRTLWQAAARSLRSHRCRCSPRCIPPNPDIVSCGKPGGSPAVVGVLPRSAVATRATDRDGSPPAACGHHRDGAAAQGFKSDVVRQFAPTASDSCSAPGQ